NFRHVAHYDEQRGSVDSFLEAHRATDVRIASLDLSIAMRAGERIHTESSYKFSERDVADLGTASGFRLSKTWHDRARRFSVHLLVRT
ncbi:MAG: L-histidine N(alpha)-methyltransferase, partial [Candidatus Eremiobacteraeota bacterium]|nr:L-histidine N(alpha)-methyltransferase [Candidatus Eremiobacteraeota bacterium]